MKTRIYHLENRLGQFVDLDDEVPRSELIDELNRNADLLDQANDTITKLRIALHNAQQETERLKNQREKHKKQQSNPKKVDSKSGNSLSSFLEHERSIQEELEESKKLEYQSQIENSSAETDGEAKQPVVFTLSSLLFLGIIFLTSRNKI